MQPPHQGVTLALRKTTGDSRHRRHPRRAELGEDTVPVEPMTFKIFLDEGFSMLALSSVIGVLNAANQTMGIDAYAWRLVSSTGGTVLADTKVAVTTDASLADEFDASRRAARTFIIMLSGAGEDRLLGQTLLVWLREGISHGARVAAVGADAAEFLAREGFLDGRRCAMHWRNYGLAMEKYPAVAVTRTFHEVDGPFHTCAGELSAFDLMQRIVGADHGAGVVDSISEIVLQSRVRTIGERQVLPDHARLRRIGSPLVQLVDQMIETIPDPVSLKTLMGKSALSRRQVERLFIRQMGMSPKRYYMQLRLERAHELLKYSSMAIVDVAVATGFVSHSHFTKSYKGLFGVQPIHTRRTEEQRGREIAECQADEHACRRLSKVA